MLNLKTKKIIEESFSFVRQNPKFWFLGFFLILFINHEVNTVINVLNQITTYLTELISNIKIPVILQSEEITNLFTLSQNHFYKFDISDIFILAIILLFLYLILISQIIVISLANYSNQNIHKSKINFKNIFLKSHKFLGSTAVIYLLLGVAIFIVLNLPSLFKNYLISNNLPNFFTISYITIILLLSLIFAFIAKFSLFFIIIKKEKIFPSILKSIKFFFKNWYSAVKISLSLLVMTILFGLIIFLIFTGILIPVSVFLRLLLNLNSPSLYLTTIVVLTSIISAVFLILLSFFAYFQFLTWPLYFLKIVKKM